MRNKMVAALGSIPLVPAFASLAEANTGLPMLAAMWPLVMLALLPIIAIEAYVLSAKLAMAVAQVAPVAFVANAASTIVGVPITWFLMLFVPGMQATAWLAPMDGLTERESNSYATGAALALLVPFFFASWWIEYIIAIRMMPWLEASSIKTAVLAGNLITYVCLAVVIVGISTWLSRSERRPKRKKTRRASVEASEKAHEDGRARILEPSHGSETPG